MNKCKTCGEPMVGAGDQCSDCAFPALARASEAARRAVEEGHFARTGERKSCGELFRAMLDRWSRGQAA